QLLDVAGPAVGRGARDAELGGELLEAQALAREESTARAGAQIGGRRDGAQPPKLPTRLAFLLKSRHGEKPPLRDETICLNISQKTKIKKISRPQKDQAIAHNDPQREDPTP